MSQVVSARWASASLLSFAMSSRADTGVSSMERKSMSCELIMLDAVRETDVVPDGRVIVPGSVVR